MSNGRNDYFDIAISVFDMGLAIAKNLKKLTAILKKKRGKMNTYIITYRSASDHDCCKVWCEADSPKDAASKTLREYWDVEEIISIRRA